MTQAQHEHRLSIVRIIAAPTQRVFDAWIDPEHRKKWWAAEPGMTCDFAEIDARVGGRFRINMKQRYHDGIHEWVCVGEFRLVDPPRKLVFTWSWEHEDAVVPGSAARDTLVTVEFRTVDGGTEVAVTHEQFATDAIRADHEKGWNGCLESLANYLGGSSHAKASNSE